MTTTTKETKMSETTTSIATQIAWCQSYEGLAVLCQGWAAEQGIELVGTYRAMAARTSGSTSATFKAFAARVKDLDRLARHARRGAVR